MRAKEFILENTKGIMPRYQQNPSKGLNLISDGPHWMSDYKTYRLGLALGPCDGINVPDVDSESWIGRWKTLHPYSQQEQDMIELAAKAVGINYKDLNNGNMNSLEPDDTYTKSPVADWTKK